MKFSINREALLKPLTLVAGVVERRQTLPVLSNILLSVDDQQLTLTGTDLEVEIVGKVTLDQVESNGSITVAARKLLDICKSLPDHAVVNIQQVGEHLLLCSARSKFKLSTLPVGDFPNIEDSPESFELELSQDGLLKLIERTSFAMAQQDVRYYLNGMLLEIKTGQIRAVTTDGHRLATSIMMIDLSCPASQQLIVPRKGILELARLLNAGDMPIKLMIGKNHIRAFTDKFIFTSKLVDGKFPDYERVIPRNGDKVVLINRTKLRAVLSRAAILSNEKYRGVRMLFSDNSLTAIASNPQQEKAEELLLVDYQGECQ